MEAIVQPGSREFAASWDPKANRLRVSVKAEAEKGLANAEVVRELSRLFGVPVSIIRGHKGRRKLLRIGLGLEEIRRRAIEAGGGL